MTGGGPFLLGNVSALVTGPSVRGTIHPLVREVALTLKLRVAAAPEEVRIVTMAALEQVLPAGMDLELLHQACFRPGRPSPTHHLK